MSENVPINDMPESNGGSEQPSYNGETEEHTSKSNFLSKLLMIPTSIFQKNISMYHYLIAIIYLSDKSPGSGEDKTPDSVCDNGIKKNNTASIVGSNTTNTTSRAKKRKKAPRDATAPKQPLTGYFRYSFIQFKQYN